MHTFLLYSAPLITIIIISLIYSCIQCECPEIFYLENIFILIHCIFAIYSEIEFLEYIFSYLFIIYVLVI